MCSHLMWMHISAHRGKLAFFSSVLALLELCELQNTTEQIFFLPVFYRWCSNHKVAVLFPATRCSLMCFCISLSFKLIHQCLNDH